MTTVDERILETTAREAPAYAPSSYLQYLPAPYQGDEFMGRFLLIFESILGPIERTVDNLPNYLEPKLTPEQMLPWLTSWVAQELDENWSLEQRRELADSAAWLHRWRGTRLGLREHIRIYTGHEPLIVENFRGFRLGADAALGINTPLGQRQPHTIHVTAFNDQTRVVDDSAVARIIEENKPAHVEYTLQIIRLPLGAASAEESAASLVGASAREGA